jgi:hypothetical protein
MASKHLAQWETNEQREDLSYDPNAVSPLRPLAIPILPDICKYSLLRDSFFGYVFYPPRNPSHSFAGLHLAVR